MWARRAASHPSSPPWRSFQPAAAGRPLRRPSWAAQRSPQQRLPAGFQETIRPQQAGDRPTAVRFAGRARLRRQKRGQIVVYDSRGPDADGLRRPAHPACTTSGTAACSAWRSTRSSRPAARTSTPSTRTTRTRQLAQTVPRWGDACPTPPGASADGCVVTGRLSRLPTAPRSADRGLVPAVPEPLGRLARLRPRRRALRLRRRRRELQLRRLRPGRIAGQPVRRPRGRAAERRRRRPRREARCAARTCATPDRPASTARSCASTRTPAPRCPTIRTPRQSGPERPPDRGLRPAQPVPHHGAARHQRGLVGDVGWGGGRRSTAYPTRPAPVRNFGWPCYEGTERQGGYDNLNLTSARTSTAGAGAQCRRSTRTPRRAGRRRRDLPDRSARRSPGCRVLRRAAAFPPATPARCSSPTTRATASGP